MKLLLIALLGTAGGLVAMEPTAVQIAQNSGHVAPLKRLAAEAILSDECSNLFDNNRDHYRKILNDMPLDARDHIIRRSRWWQVRPAACIATLTASRWVPAAYVGSYENRLPIERYSCTIKLWDAQWNIVYGVRDNDKVTCVAYNSRGSQLVSGSNHGDIDLWDLQSRTRSNIFSEHDDWVTAVSFHPSDNYLLSGSTDNTIKIWGLSEGSCVNTLNEHIECVSSVACHPGGDQFVSASDDGAIKCWDLESGKIIRSVDTETMVHAVAYRPDGNLVAAACRNLIEFFDPRLGACIKSLDGHDESVLSSLAYHPQGHELIAVSADESIKVWDLRSCRPVITLPSDIAYSPGTDEPLFSSVAYHPDGNQFAVAVDRQNTVRIIDLPSAQVMSILKGHSAGVKSVVYHPEGHQLASGASDGSVRLWSPW